MGRSRELGRSALPQPLCFYFSADITYGHPQEHPPPPGMTPGRWVGPLSRASAQGFFLGQFFLPLHVTITFPYILVHPVSIKTTQTLLVCRFFFSFIETDICFCQVISPVTLAYSSSNHTETRKMRVMMIINCIQKFNSTCLLRR